MNTYLRKLTQAGRDFGRAVMGSRSGFEGASTGRRLAGWSETTSAISALLSSEGDTLRARSRGLVRKNCWAKSAQEAWVANAIGTGITPEPLHPDEATRTQLKKLWDKSSVELDADGLTDFYGLQALAMREIFEAGEVLVRLRPRYVSDGLAVPVQMQMIESEHLPLRDNRTIGGNMIRAGIEFTPYGKRVAYHLYREHPGLGAMSLLSTNLDQVRVTAESALHIFAPLRAGQLRGMPWLAPVMVTLYELDQFVDAVLVRQKLANMFLGWQRSIDSSGANPIDYSATMGGETAPDGIGFGSLESGTLLDLGNTGMTLEFSSPPDPAASFEMFVGKLLHCVSAGTSVPYTLLDWNTSEVNYSSMRGELLEFRRRIEQFQFSVMVHQFCRPTWRWWINNAVMAGVLETPTDQDGWDALYAVEWRTPRWAWVDPLKDVQAAKESVRCGFTSRTAVIHELGYDPEQVDAEIASDNARAKRLGIVSDADPAQTQKNGAAQGTASTDETPMEKTDADDPFGE